MRIERIERIGLWNDWIGGCLLNLVVGMDGWFEIKNYFWWHVNIM